jgi:hypothetical protein
MKFQFAGQFSSIYFTRLTIGRNPPIPAGSYKECRIHRLAPELAPGVFAMVLLVPTLEHWEPAA